MPDALTDRQFRQQIKRIKRLIKKWHHPLVGWWRTTHVYCREGIEEEDALALTNARWEYLDATISWNMPLAAETSDEYLEYALVHELCHLLVNEMHGGDATHEERVVTTIARAFMHMRGEQK